MKEKKGKEKKGFDNLLTYLVNGDRERKRTPLQVTYVNVDRLPTTTNQGEGVGLPTTSVILIFGLFRVLCLW